MIPGLHAVQLSYKTNNKSSDKSVKIKIIVTLYVKAAWQIQISED
jgi:hypothetical protein